MKVKIKNGFTLIELMITVAIVGILAALALPAYQDYVIRAQVSEALSLAAGMKANISEFHSSNGHLPTVAESMALRASLGVPTGRYVSETLMVGDGVIMARFGNEANEKIAGYAINLGPVETTGGNLKWVCISQLPQKYLPSSCYKAGTSAAAQAMQP